MALGRIWRMDNTPTGCGNNSPPVLGFVSMYPKSRRLNNLIASRSPPSHDPKLLSFFRICPLPGTHFCHFGLTFGVTFASLGPLLEHFGYIFWAKKRPEAPEVPPEVPKGDFPSKSSLFGTPFGSLFCRCIAFSHEIIMFFHVVFKALFLCSFLCVFNRWEQVACAQQMSIVRCSRKTVVLACICIRVLGLFPWRISGVIVVVCWT